MRVTRRALLAGAAGLALQGSAEARDRRLSSPHRFPSQGGGSNS